MILICWFLSEMLPYYCHALFIFAFLGLIDPLKSKRKAGFSLGKIVCTCLHLSVMQWLASLGSHDTTMFIQYIRMQIFSVMIFRSISTFLHLEMKVHKAKESKFHQLETITYECVDLFRGFPPSFSWYSFWTKRWNSSWILNMGQVDVGKVTQTQICYP